jgi:nicotinamidase-related amidase
MAYKDLVANAEPFLEWIVDWQASLPVFDLATQVSDPNAAAILSVDVINGFCCEGPLSSPRVASIVPPIARLFERAHNRGIRYFVLMQDTHQDQAVEFTTFPSHCVSGSAESETVPELMELPFAGDYTIFPKNSISSDINTELPAWLDSHAEITDFVVVGDCTDLCTYQLAMYLRLRANALQRASDRVILPIDCVNTYDLPIKVASQLGVFPHHGDLLHLVYLYSMALNGVHAVSSVV